MVYFLYDSFAGYACQEIVISFCEALDLNLLRDDSESKIDYSREFYFESLLRDKALAGRLLGYVFKLV